MAKYRNSSSSKSVAVDAGQGKSVQAGFYNASQRSPQMMKFMEYSDLSDLKAGQQRMMEIKEMYSNPSWEHQLRHRLSVQEQYQGGYNFIGHGGKHDPNAKK